MDRSCRPQVRRRRRSTVGFRLPPRLTRLPLTWLRSLSRLQINKETSKIVLNTLGLTLGEATLVSSHDDVVQRATSEQWEPTQQRTTFTFPKTVAAGSQARLTVTYSADLVRGRMVGYFASMSTSGEVYAITQFQVRLLLLTYSIFR